MQTSQQYDEAVSGCKSTFLKKTRDYGTAWRVLRPISIVDQVFIKAKRIRTLQETGVQRIGDDIPSEFQGIVNYGVIGLAQMRLPKTAPDELPEASVSDLYDEAIASAKSTMLDKNHDYGEAWRDMSQEGLTDLILMKLMRIRRILANDGKTLVSEGIDANYIDIINYAAFALIMEGTHI